jgi:predicted RNase H-like nuclease
MRVVCQHAHVSRDSENDDEFWEPLFSLEEVSWIKLTEIRKLEALRALSHHHELKMADLGSRVQIDAFPAPCITTFRTSARYIRIQESENKELR